jgi:phenylalanine-4-hydroxylase
VTEMLDQNTDSVRRAPRPGPALIENNNGEVSISLPENHPGFGDERYIERRAWIAETAVHARPADPAPYVPYSQNDRRVWQQVTKELYDLHRRYASVTYLDSISTLNLPSNRPPQLRDVSDTVEKATGFKMTSVAGSVEARIFYESLADRNFRATQYIRHASQPGFSPEPDMIHEVVGHGPHLVNERWAELYQLAGAAARRLENPTVVDYLSSVFWFCIECGLVREDGEIKAWGASLMSSVKEMSQFMNAHIKPLDVVDMVHQDYNSHAQQPVLFAANSQAHLEDFLGTFLTTVNDSSSYR